MSDMSGAYDGGATGVMSGIVVGTRVATTMGWRDVGGLQVGDMILTFDGGLQPVTGVSRSELWSGEGACPASFWPLMVPAGALENVKPMRILPRQGVMLESDIAEQALGDPFALIQARALDGVRGIERVCPGDQATVVKLSFDTDQVIYAEQGTLLFCPAGKDLLQVAIKEAPEQSDYSFLPVHCATQLAQGLEIRAAGRSCLESFQASLQMSVHATQVAA
ncbi:Hint domain-containing protein [Rhodobacteraceae bacterium D3-12]|nr:Hint domain-containing protein [Rhodobacteraceae bacterium D3-12]